MKRTFRGLSALLIALPLTASVSIAHHSFAMFDKTLEKVATGKVVRWTFNNPHSWLYMNITEKHFGASRRRRLRRYSNEASAAPRSSLGVPSPSSTVR